MHFHTRDIWGLICSSLTFMIMVFAGFVQIHFILGPWKGISWHCYLYTILFSLSCASHWRSVTTDPGFVPKELASDNPNVLTCSRCKTPKPLEAHHCSNCQRCVIQLDHHCPWVNNCVGLLNQRSFVLFLFWTSVTCWWCFVTIVCRFVFCTKVENKRYHFCNPEPVDTTCTFLNLVFSLLFGIFTTLMLYDQLSVIFENTTYIDKLKGVVKEKTRNARESLEFTFGEPLGPYALLPKSPTQQLLKDFDVMLTLVRKRSHYD